MLTRATIFCCLILAFLGQTAFAETRFSVGTASYATHRDAFFSLAQTFVGDFAPSVQDIWYSVDLNDGAVSSATSVDVNLQSSQSIGLAYQTEVHLGNTPVELTTGFSYNATIYSLPDGITPFVDPMIFNVTSLDVDIRAALTGQIAEFGDQGLRYAVGPGQRISSYYTNLTSALLDVKDYSVFSYSYLGGELILESDVGRTVLSARGQASGDAEFQLIQSFNW